MSGLVKTLFFLGDLVFLNLSIFLSIAINRKLGGVEINADYLYLFIFSNLTWFFLVMVSNPYNVTKGLAVSKILKSQLSFIFIHLLVVAGLIFFLHKSYSAAEIGLMYAIFVPIFFVSKVITFYFRKVFTAETLIKNYVLLGNNEVSDELRRYYLVNPQLGYRFLKRFDFNDSTFLTEVRTFCLENEVHEIYCCAPNITNEELTGLINFGLDSMIKVRFMIASQADQQTLLLDKSDRLPGVDISVVPLDETVNQAIKRVFDIVASAVFILTVMWWLIPLIGLAIKIDSPGPVFFVQLRSGRGNRPFKCLKFRTMVVNAASDSLQASKGDRRITKLGHFLRRTSIDELPQFLNAFIGTMSIVGPRPHMLKHTEEYSKLIDRFMGRHYVKPGITGLAQCLGFRGETRDIIDMENRVRMDRYYIENWTFWFDIKIIFLTVISLIRGSDKAF